MAKKQEYDISRAVTAPDSTRRAIAEDGVKTGHAHSLTTMSFAVFAVWQARQVEKAPHLVSATSLLLLMALGGERTEGVVLGLRMDSA